jgi:hypothetical protein
MINVQTSLNGNIFMHCPVDMAEDFQVSWQCRALDYHIIMDDKHTHTHTHVSIRHSIVIIRFSFVFFSCTVVPTRFGTLTWNEMWLKQLITAIFLLQCAAVNRVEYRGCVAQKSTDDIRSGADVLYTSPQMLLLPLAKDTIRRYRNANIFILACQVIQPPTTTSVSRVVSWEATTQLFFQCASSTKKEKNKTKQSQKKYYSYLR